jgi:hypothetical protein
MSETIKCKACGSNKVIPEVKITDHGFMDDNHNLAIEIHAKPKALLFKNTKKGELNATICCDCGNVDLVINNPDELWEAYKKGIENLKR